ncbi:F-box/kelch-repeat protein At2g44130 [Ricinus communis]|uniref:F-box domain-containing protein n=1 Tax=Ricinus communis TaxID=3988 RepID=B9STA7_RICCO|nr:F-box/kelch-repeat protein At2g44130 [Ricinus communis]EEF33182.1 conserved hypothetical protein [Ricinus communis]|eukprot:XP_002529226.1 F-box/kelch-repeat protein At2g44130 [Ricinus communis]
MEFQPRKKDQEEEVEEEKKQELIPGLPDEIAMECLVKVPYQFHCNMKSVCHTWQDLISDPSFYQQRRKSGTSEHLVCLVQPLPQQQHDSALDVTPDMADPTTVTKKEDKQEQEQQQQQIHSPPQFAISIYNLNFNIWQRTRPQGGIPMFCQCLAIPSSGKILLLGGWDSNTLEPVPDVHILDLTGGCRWRRGASMSVSRSFFACAVVGPSMVYVAGGHDGQKNALRSAEVYDVDRDEWRMLPDMIEERDECQGLAWDGDSKFWVVSGYGTDSQGQFRSDAECYDPTTGSWSKFDGVWPFSSISPRGATATVSVNRDQNQWWWFLGGEQQQQQLQLQTSGEEVKENENMRLEIVTSIPVPACVTGSNPCVISLGYDANKHHQVFVMSGNGNGNGRRTSSSSLSCSECDCEGAFILDRDCNNGSTKWNHVHTPVGFSGFPFSASHLTI